MSFDSNEKKKDVKTAMKDVKTAILGWPLGRGALVRMATRVPGGTEGPSPHPRTLDPSPGPESRAVSQTGGCGGASMWRVSPAAEGPCPSPTSVPADGGRLRLAPAHAACVARWVGLVLARGDAVLHGT